MNVQDQNVVISALKLYACTIDDDLRKRYAAGEQSRHPEQVARDERLRDRAIEIHRALFAAQMGGRMSDTKASEQGSFADRLRALGAVCNAPTFDGPPVECVVASLETVLEQAALSRDAVTDATPDGGEWTVERIGVSDD